jgi:FtsP/CotA-like multicopper oxidase with cupredoxin domain
MERATMPVTRSSPGEQFQYRFVAKDEGTFWFHPHVRSDEQIERGLAGAVVVRAEGAEPAHTERVFMLDDVDTDAAGEIVIEPSDEDLMAGRHGATVLVNGLVEPVLPAVRGDVERWRFVNASNGRYFAVAAPPLGLRVVASDGGALLEPFTVPVLRIAPGERFTVEVDLSGVEQDTITVIAAPVDTGHGAIDQDSRTLFSLTLGDGEPRAPRALVPRPLDPIASPGAEPTRDVPLREVADPTIGTLYLIGDEAWPFNTPWTSTAGAVEVWRVRNETMGDHPFHVHGMFFQVLDDAGQPRRDLGWKDTIDVQAGQNVVLALPLERGHWMFHCQIPEHAERGMMGEIHVAP